MSMQQISGLEIRKTRAEIVRTVLYNTIQMLIYRGWMNSDATEEELDMMIDQIIRSKKEDKIHFIPLNNNLMDIPTYYQNDIKTQWKKFNGTTVAVFMSNLTVASNEPALNTFIDKYSDYHKIIVVDSIVTKMAIKLTSVKHVEIFPENALMIDVGRHVTQPIFEILTTDDAKEVRDAYGVKLSQMPRIYSTDPMSRYMFAAKEQIMRIIRTSEKTGNVVSYRIVI